MGKEETASDTGLRLKANARLHAERTACDTFPTLTSAYKEFTLREGIAVHKRVVLLLKRARGYIER